MKYKIFLSTFLLAIFLTGCLQDDIRIDQNENEMIGNTYVSIRIGVPEGEHITVTSIRVVIFSNEPGFVGDYITHSLFRFNGGEVFTFENGKAIIDGSSDDLRISVPTIAGKSMVYVILNEDVSHFGGESLTQALNNAKLVNSPKAYFQGLLEAYLPYNNLVAADDNGEPAFIMLAYGEFYVEEGYSMENPFLLNFTGTPSAIAVNEDVLDEEFPLVRSMARVTIEGITSALTASQRLDGVVRSDDMMEQVSRIFILDMGLKNVPTQYWIHPNWGGTPTSFSDFSFGRADAMFLQDDPTNNIAYFSRSWDGDMTITVTSGGQVRQTQRLRDGRIWWAGQNAGSGQYDFDREVLDRALRDNPNRIQSQAFIPANQIGNPNFIPPPPMFNEGNFFAYYAEALNRPITPNDFLPPTFEFLGGTEDLRFDITGSDWWLMADNMSFYIPENLNTGNVTSLYIKAARASYPTMVKGYEINFDTDVTWALGGAWNYSQSSGGQNLNAGSITSEMILARRGWEFDVITVGSISHHVVRHYIDLGIMRWRDGTFTGEVTFTREDDPDIEFKITLDDKNHAQTFTIPIATGNNGKVFRNHEYRFSVHATHPWWNNGGTRSTNNTVPFMLQRVD